MNVLHWLVLHGPMSVKIPVLAWALIDCLLAYGISGQDVCPHYYSTIMSHLVVIQQPRFALADSLPSCWFN